MTDKKILEEVYKMCCNPFERCDVKSFIEQEWQRADEEEYETKVGFSWPVSGKSP